MENPTVQKSDTTAEKTRCAPSCCDGDKGAAKTRMWRRLSRPWTALS